MSRVGLIRSLNLRNAIAWWTATALLTFSAPARATRQCPAEFGPKDPLVDLLGWSVVAVGVVGGALFFTVVIRHTRGMRRLSRAVVVALGLAGAVLVGVAGLALALLNFFFRC